MAREKGAKCKKCSRLNTKLFLKGERCYSNKCALEKKKSAGSFRERRLSQYGQQLREKQKIRWMYGLSETQLKRYFQIAERSVNVTGEALLRLLERRLDNAVYRLGFSLSRDQARQLIVHGHFMVNGHKVDIPSRLVKEGDVIELRKKNKKFLSMIRQILQVSEKRVIPEWLEMDREPLRGKVKRFPYQEELNQEINRPLIVEYYSR